MTKIRKIIDIILAFSRKEFKLNTRYKWTYISQVVVLPILHALPFIIIYWGVTAFSTGLTEINSANYLAWVLLGSLTFSIFTQASGVFRQRFAFEKFWNTTYGTIIAPVSKYYLLFGVIIELAVQAVFMSVFFLVLSAISFPTAIINILAVIVILFVMLTASAGISLIGGTFYLINENSSVLFDYFKYFLIFFSSYAIPYELYPGFLGIFVQINPFYHFINLSRNIWWYGLYSIDLLWSFLYIICFAIACVVIGVYVFSKYTRRFGVRGY